MAGDKLAEAEAAIRLCQGKLGFYASGENYYGRYWLRDTVYSLNGLLRLGYVEPARLQLLMFLRSQKPDGRVPDALCHPWHPRSIVKRLAGYARSPRSTLSYPIDLRFVRRPYFHEWTNDSNLLLILGLNQLFGGLVNRTPLMSKAWSWVDQHLDSETGLLRGSGWLDAMKNYRGRFSFTTQILLARIFAVAGQRERCEKTMEAVDRIFWREQLDHYGALTDSSTFDTLGHALGLLWDLIPRAHISRVVEAFRKVRVKAGYTNLYPPHPDCGQKPFTYQNSAVWPFVHGFAVLALIHVGLEVEALTAFRLWNRFLGFNEWYSPFDSRPMGSRSQLWSAALYVETCYALRQLGITPDK